MSIDEDRYNRSSWKRETKGLESSASSSISTSGSLRSVARFSDLRSHHVPSKQPLLSAEGLGELKSRCILRESPILRPPSKCPSSTGWTVPGGLTTTASSSDIILPNQGTAVNVPDPNMSRYADRVFSKHTAVPNRYEINLAPETPAGYIAYQFAELVPNGHAPSHNRHSHYQALAFLAMASSEVDLKFLTRFAINIKDEHPLLAQILFQIEGNLAMLSPYVIKARKMRRLDATRDTKSVDLYCRIIWYAREGLVLLEQWVLPMVGKFTELKVLCYKLRASYYHLYVLFHNKPPVTLKAATQVHTPPGLTSPRATKDPKGKGVDRGSPDPFRPTSVQPTHPLEGGPVGGRTTTPPPTEYAADFLVPAQDYRPLTLQYFQEASSLADKHCWGSHPLRLSVRVEFTAFLYDCLHEKERSRQLAKATIAEVYNAQEGMDDDMFEDAAELVGILGRMMKRGLGSGNSVAGSTPGASSRAGMDNAI
jgi:hypothetical protein